jgi:hypothetical protein
MEKFLFGIILAFIVVTVLSVYRINGRINGLERNIAERDSILLSQDSILYSRIQYQGKINKLLINNINTNKKW